VLDAAKICNALPDNVASAPSVELTPPSTEDIFISAIVLFSALYWTSKQSGLDIVN